MKLRLYQQEAIDDTEAMIVFGSNNIILSAPTSWGKSIYIAALKNDTGYILNYLKEGNDLHLKDERKQTLLHLATRNKARISLQLLLQLGLDPNESDKYKDTPLHIASHMGDLEMVKLLLQYHANPNSRNDKRQTPLHRACFKGTVSVINELVNHEGNLFLKV